MGKKQILQNKTHPNIFFGEFDENPGTDNHVFLRSRHCRSVVVLTTKSTFGAPLSQPMFFFEITMKFC